MGTQISKYRAALDAFDEACYLYRTDTQKYAGLMASAMNALAIAEAELLEMEKHVKELEAGQ